MCLQTDVLQLSQDFVFVYLFFLNKNSVFADSLTCELTLSEMAGSMKFKLLYHS